MHDEVDLNLLRALDALLSERSVTGAARRLGLSASAMSRTLKRLRAATGDPLLVRAGRVLVATPYAAELRDRVHALARDAHAVLRPQTARLDLASLQATFTLRANQAFVAFFGAALCKAVAEAAPGVRLRFAPKPDKQVAPLREGRIDLEVGVAGTSAPEMRRRHLFDDRFVGVARSGHALLAAPGVTPQRYAACAHVVASPAGDFHGVVDEALAALGWRRQVAVVVPEFLDAMRIVSHSDLIAMLPRSCLGQARQSGDAGSARLRAFELPVAVPGFSISAIWHPRLDADPAHRWLRDLLTALCRAAYPAS